MAEPEPPSDWERELKRQIGRRYGAMARDAAFPPGGGDKMRAAGYPGDWVNGLPDEMAASYSGCGFPFAGLDALIARRVVDLGCGAGLDALYLAGRHVGIGMILGIDLAPDMVARAAAAAARMSEPKIKFMASDLERLPLESGSADLVVANASLNLAADKGRALDEIFRILEPGGRLIARDLVRSGPLPAEILTDPQSYNTSLGGVPEESDMLDALASAGFHGATIQDHTEFSVVYSVAIRAEKP
ncbi:MAG: methyltransferase domain-containing protein [Rhodospirillaceae bacterium]|nr:methyltransferase domain-containing protein [Rhodospirillaceae bacterium]MBT7233233.1 methyltransferase domain-containing protein [Rhodospirillaceae bacterium]